jgi:lysophospholipase L1-like esterase
MVGRRTLLRTTLVGTLLLTVSGSGLAPAHAGGSRPLAVVSLGDSYIAGNAGRWLGNSPDNTGDRRGTDRAFDPSLDPPYDPALVYEDQTCWRSDVAEINQVRFPGVTPVNLACSGATSGDIPGQSLRLAEVARTHRVLAIVLSIGGNDAHFASIVDACARAFIVKTGPCNPGQQANLDRDLPLVRAGVGQAIDGVRATMTAAGYRDRSYRVILQSYPAPISLAADTRHPESDPDAARFLVAGCPFYDADLDWGHTGLPGQLAETLRAVAAERGVQFLDVREAFRGHELCHAAARQPETVPEAATSEWVRWIDVPFLQGDYLAESLHPNAYGQQALGRCLRLTLQSLGDVSCHGIPGRPPSSVYLRPLR